MLASIGCRVLIGGSSFAVDLPGSENAKSRRAGKYGGEPSGVFYRHIIPRHFPLSL
jgi:hypothetical protein